MIISLVLVLLVTASGTVTTYLYDQGANLASRLCAGACTGLAALGLVGFIFASLLGLTPFAIFLTAFVLTIPFIALRNSVRRSALTKDFANASQATSRLLSHPSWPALGYFLFYLGVSIILWKVFSRAMFELPDGIYTGLLNNFGDLPFHISVITSFAYGNNFPPEDPTYAGVKFTYPFLSDFVSAIFVRCGADLRHSMFIENFILGVSFVGLLHRWALELVKDRLAAIFTPLLVLLNGGFGWLLLWEPLKQNEMDLWATLQNLLPSYTIIPETSWRWGNAISTLLVPQRGMLLGLPIAVIVFTQWWIAAAGNGELGNGELGNGEQGKRKGGKGKKKKGKHKNRQKLNRRDSTASSGVIALFPNSPFTLSFHRMVAAGVIAGLLPLAHAHSFVVVMVVGGFIALIQSHWRDWLIFFVVASVIALPQMWWSTHGSAVDSSSFFAFEFGWDSAKETFFGASLAGKSFFETRPTLRTVLERLPDVLWFWLKNTGLFIPLILVAIFWRGKDQLISRRLLYFYLPFTLCFFVPNVIKLAPWVWDNIKVLYYWWLASAPLVALLLARLWQRGLIPRVIAVTLLCCVTLAGSLDVASIVARSSKYQIFDRAGIEFAEIVKQKTASRALIVHAPVHNHPVFLTGRRSVMGYPGHIWTHGLDFVTREGEIKRFYAGSLDVSQLQPKNEITHVVVSPLERHVANVNDQFFSRFTSVGGAGGYRLYQIAQP